ncbi:MAG TPA: fused MFS/spermidine synthase [Symbiobacteriaceae bacterium]|nr:fused MFS/spermidine synthase [Symbiobacteriaceae bacterium]
MNHEYQGMFGPVIVREFPGMRALYLGTMLQGGMILGAPYTCTSRVLRAFHLIRSLRPTLPGSVLIIGLGAGELPRSFWGTYPDVRITVAEIDSVIADVAIRHFDLPQDERLAVVVGDGEAILQDAPDRYDLIILDANAGDAGLPPQFRERAFLDLARARLNPGGMLAANVIGALTGPGSDGVRQFLTHAEANFPERYRLTFGAPPEATQNIVVFFGDQEPLPVERIPTADGIELILG